MRLKEARTAVRYGDDYCVYGSEAMLRHKPEPEFVVDMSISFSPREYERFREFIAGMSDGECIRDTDTPIPQLPPPARLLDGKQTFDAEFED